MNIFATCPPLSFARLQRTFDNTCRKLFRFLKPAKSAPPKRSKLITCLRSVPPVRNARGGAAAPLIAVGKPLEVLSAVLGLPVGTWSARPGWAALLFAETLWFWHAPAPYAATFTSMSVYWCMHVTASGARSGSGRRCWRIRGRTLMLVLAGLVSSVQMGLARGTDHAGPAHAHECGWIGLFRFLSSGSGTEEVAKRRQNLDMVTHDFSDRQ